MSTFTHRYAALGLGSSTLYSPVFGNVRSSGKVNIQFKHTMDISPVTISNITNAFPAVVDAGELAHGLVTGQRVTIACPTMESIDATTFTITVLTAESFELDGSDTSLDPPFDEGSYSLPLASLTTSVEGSIRGTDWVELVAGVVDPTKISNSPAWPHWRLKHVITNGNKDTLRFFVANRAGAGY